MAKNPHLPDYAAPDIKKALLNAGASGTIYSLVMPETEEILRRVTGLSDVGGESERAFLSMYHEAWTNKQDPMHEAYFDRWFEWSAPIVSIEKNAFPYRYPTAGASEGIFKVMAEYAARQKTGSIHVFEGEYEGFSAYAASLNLPIVKHGREDWESVPERMNPNDQFWVSQPSAIDGMVWEHFESFAKYLFEKNPDAQLIPDLTYVGSVARPFSVDLNFPNVPCIIMSHSKPFGGYYQRVGGVISRDEHPSLVGNKWFKNLLSLKWATSMMEEYGVHDLPRKYRPTQEEAVTRIGKSLGVDQLRAADVNLLGIFPYTEGLDPVLKSVRRGSGKEEVARICVTPSMAMLINPEMTPTTSKLLLQSNGLYPS